MHPEIVAHYGNKLRVRACGLCIRNDALLMVNHTLGHDVDFWAPPGGGIEFMETARDTIVREFREETGYEVEVGKVLFICEFRKAPLHAIELYFKVRIVGGKLSGGADPETKHPVIREVRFMTADDLSGLPIESLHGLFAKSRIPADLMSLTGYLEI